MASASDIGANFSAYQGNANLGGGSLGSFQLDTRPLQDFARYTMLYNREEQERKQKEAEKAAEELASVAGYDLTSSIPKDSKVLQEGYDDLIKFVRENPGALSFKNRDLWLKYQEKKNGLANDIRGGKVRHVLNMAREEEIAKAKDEIDKKRMRKELDSEIASKDIRTPIFFTQQYDLTVPDLGKNTGQSILVNRRLPNEIIQENFEIFDAAEADRKGAAVTLDINFDETTVAGQEKKKKFGSNIYVKGAEILQGVINEAKVGSDTALDSKAQQELIREKISGVAIARDVVAIVDKYNEYTADIQKRFKDGELFGSGINPNAYTPINWEDGLDPVELSKISQFAAWAGDKREDKIIQTNEKIEKDRLGLGWANLGLEQKKFDQATQRYEEAVKGTEIEKNAAVVFAQNLLKDLYGLASMKGDNGTRVLTPADIRKMTVEQRKYLGLETPPIRKDGVVVESGGLNPMKLEETDIIEVSPDGTVRVMKDAKYDEKRKMWDGDWDNTRSTSIWNAATNRLNEENIKSAGKERNAYLPIDLRGKDGTIQIDVSGGGTTKKESSSTKTPQQGDLKLTDAEYYIKYKKAKPKQ